MEKKNRKAANLSLDTAPSTSARRHEPLIECEMTSMGQRAADITVKDPGMGQERGDVRQVRTLVASRGSRMVTDTASLVSSLAKRTKRCHGRPSKSREGASGTT